MYGGRAIDSFDRRVLTVYVDEYFGDFLFYTFRRFHFYKDKAVAYKIPPNGPKKTYVGQLLFHYFTQRKHYFLSPLTALACFLLQMRLNPCHWQTQQRYWVFIPMQI